MKNGYRAKRPTRHGPGSVKPGFPPPALDEGPRSRRGSHRGMAGGRGTLFTSAREGGIFPDVICSPFSGQHRSLLGRFSQSRRAESCDFRACVRGPLRFEPTGASPSRCTRCSKALPLRICPRSHRRSNRIADLKRAIRRSADAAAGQPCDAWLAGLGVDEHSIRQGWNRFKRRIAAFSRGAPERADGNVRRFAAGRGRVLSRRLDVRHHGAECDQVGCHGARRVPDPADFPRWRPSEPMASPMSSRRR